MGFLGLIPSENTTGEKRRQGSITKMGNAHVRRVLCEASWSYDNPPTISRHLLKRQEHLSPEIREVAWKAQVRLCGRFRHFTRQRKHRNKINTIVARELVGFIWHIATLATVDMNKNNTQRGEPEVYRLRRKAPKPISPQRARVAAPRA